MVKFDVLHDLVVDWAAQRRIIPNTTPLAQASKTIEEVAELVREAVREERDAILAELRLLVLPCATTAPHEVERQLTADEMAKALGVGRTVFFKRLRQYPQLKNLQRGKHWPESVMRAAFVALK